MFTLRHLDAFAQAKQLWKSHFVDVNDMYIVLKWLIELILYSIKSEMELLEERKALKYSSASDLSNLDVLLLLIVWTFSHCLMFRIVEKKEKASISKYN